MPHEMPSMESPARNRLRASPYNASRPISRTSVRPRMRRTLAPAGRSSTSASKLTSVMSHLVAERLGRRQLGGAPRGIHRRDDADEDERQNRHEPGQGTEDHARETLGHRQQVHERAETQRDSHAEGAAHERDHETLEEELPHDV